MVAGSIIIIVAIVLVAISASAIVVDLSSISTNVTYSNAKVYGHIFLSRCFIGNITTNNPGLGLFFRPSSAQDPAFGIASSIQYNNSDFNDITYNATLSNGMSYGVRIYVASQGFGEGPVTNGSITLGNMNQASYNESFTFGTFYQDNSTVWC